MIQPAFHRARIAEYAKAMTEFAEKMREEWKDGEIRDINREMMRLTLQIVGKTLFSANVDDEADEVGKALTTLIELFNYLLLPFSELLEKLPLPQVKRFNRAKGNSGQNNLRHHQRTPRFRGIGRRRSAFNAAARAGRRNGQPDDRRTSA